MRPRFVPVTLIPLVKAADHRPVPFKVTELLRPASNTRARAARPSRCSGFSPSAWGDRHRRKPLRLRLQSPRAEAGEKREGLSLSQGDLSFFVRRYLTSGIY